MGSTICTAGFPSAAIASSCFTARCDSIWYGFFIATLLFLGKRNCSQPIKGFERGSRYFLRSTGHSQRVAMRGALDGQEAQTFGANESPLVKFHGCLHIDRKKTLWTSGQLVDPAITQRISTCSDWMKLVFPGKDLVVVGFWTDWGYLNSVLASALCAGGFNSITVVDPASGAALQVKAPTLWTTLTSGTTQFLHIQASGSDALVELQKAFSRVWLKKFYALRSE